MPGASGVASRSSSGTGSAAPASTAASDQALIASARRRARRAPAPTRRRARRRRAVDMSGEGGKDAVVRHSSEGLTIAARTPGVTSIAACALAGPHAWTSAAETSKRRNLRHVGGRANVEASTASAACRTGPRTMRTSISAWHLVIVGGSYLGLELRNYRRFGSRVTVVELGPRIVPANDEYRRRSRRSSSRGCVFELEATCLAIARGRFRHRSERALW